MSSHHAIKIFHLISQCKTVTHCQSFWNMIFWHHVISLHFFRQTSHQEIISERILLYLYFFHQISPSDAVICVHFSHFNNKLSRRGNGSFSDRHSRMGFAPLWRLRPSGGHPVRKHHFSHGECTCLAAQSEKVAAETATTWEAGRQTCVCVWTFLCWITSRH